MHVTAGLVRRARSSRRWLLLVDAILDDGQLDPDQALAVRVDWKPTLSTT